MSVDATIATWKLGKHLITSTEKILLLSLADRAGEEAICWPSIKRLCSDTCLDRKSVIRLRQSCIDKGLIEYTGNFHGKQKQIPEMRLLYVSHRENDLSTPTSPKNGTGTSPKNGTGNQSQIWDTEPKIENLKEEPKNNIYNNNNFKKQKPRFDDFWNSYPVKVAKVKAKEIWKRKRLDCVADDIIAAVNAQKTKEKKWIDGFIPNPTTYLNQERWNDEIIQHGAIFSEAQKIESKQIADERAKLQEEFSMKKLQETFDAFSKRKSK